MCKRNHKEVKTEEKKEAKNVSVTWAFVFISIIFSLTMCFLVLWPVFHKNVNVREVNVSLSIPNDSLTVSQVLTENDSQMKILVEELDKQSQEITDKYNILLKSQETETDFFRLVSCIAAFIVALFGFLGYRTIKDIESKAQNLAEEKASAKADEYVSKHLANEVESQLIGIVGDTTAAKLLKEQIMKQMMAESFKPLEERVAKIEISLPAKDAEDPKAEDTSTGVFTHQDNAKIDKLTNLEEGEGHE